MCPASGRRDSVPSPYSTYRVAGLDARRRDLAANTAAPSRVGAALRLAAGGDGGEGGGGALGGGEGEECEGGGGVGEHRGGSEDGGR